MKEEKTLSIIITAHHEGRIIERTVKSLLIAAKRLDRMNIEYDFLVNIDKGDDETRKCFKRYQDQKILKIFETSFGDPGLARNSILNKANSKYVALIDADDAVSSNWFEEAMKRIQEEGEDVLVHPEAELRYDKKEALNLDLRIDAKDFWSNNLFLFGDNRWCSVILGKLEIFLKNPYPQSTKGFGYEDYYFNCITTERGIRHLIAPKTTTFLLQKTNSVTNRTHLNNDVLPYVEFFNLKKMKCRAKTKGLVEPYDGLRFRKVPNFVKTQAQEIEETGIKIVDLLNKIPKYNVSQNGTYEDYLIGVTFCKMIQRTKIKRIKELVFLDNIVELNEKKKEKNKIYIITDAENVDECGNVISFGKYFGWMYPIAKDLALTRLIVQFRPHKLVIGKSEMMNDWIERHKSYLEGNKIEVERAI